jgi:hypothetical protein
MDFWTEAVIGIPLLNASHSPEIQMDFWTVQPQSRNPFKSGIPITASVQKYKWISGLRLYRNTNG